VLPCQILVVVEVARLPLRRALDGTHVPVRAVRAAIAQLELAGANVLGVVINRADVRKGRKRSFYDGLYYSKAFSGYYTREA
jgi:Mrp family chromosome partitioning ATPase